MDPRSRNLVLAVAFAALLSLHAWLLARSAARGDTVLAVLLATAMVVFVHRVAHHSRLAWRGEQPGTRARIPERRRILVWTGVLLALLPVHSWLLLRFLELGDTVLSTLLVVAILAMSYRLAWYVSRYRRLPARD